MRWGQPPAGANSNNLPLHGIVLTPPWCLVWTAALAAGGARDSTPIVFVELLGGYWGGIVQGGAACIIFIPIVHPGDPLLGVAPARLLLSSYARRGV